MAETITIQGKEACLTSDSGQTHVVAVDDFSRGITDSTAYGMFDEPIPDNVKWMVHCGPLTVCIVEFKPELRLLKWLSKDSPVPYGPKAVCTPRQLATPYVVVKVPFRRERIVPRVEVFYRNEPLRGLDGADGELFLPNLLNCSPNAHGCMSWFCTQYLAKSEPIVGITAGLNGVAHHLWGGSFNASSEAHEGNSGFSLSRAKKVDARVTDVDRWEAESRKDPRFVLSVEWLKTGLTIRQLVLQELAVHAQAPAPNSAADLGNIILRRHLNNGKDGKDANGNGEDNAENGTGETPF
jgi:hypothetical protein